MILTVERVTIGVNLEIKMKEISEKLKLIAIGIPR